MTRRRATKKNPLRSLLRNGSLLWSLAYVITGATESFLFGKQGNDCAGGSKYREANRSFGFFSFRCGLVGSRRIAKLKLTCAFNAQVRPLLALYGASPPQIR